METTDYMANCIFRILAAPCHPSRATDRAKQLAYVCYLAHKAEDMGRAHRELIDMTNDYEAGKYAPTKGE